MAAVGAVWGLTGLPSTTISTMLRVARPGLGHRSENVFPSAVSAPEWLKMVRILLGSHIWHQNEDRHCLLHPPPPPAPGHSTFAGFHFTALNSKWSEFHGISKTCRPPPPPPGTNVHGHWFCQYPVYMSSGFCPLFIVVGCMMQHAQHIGLKAESAYSWGHSVNVKQPLLSPKPTCWWGCLRSPPQHYVRLSPSAMPMCSAPLLLVHAAPPPPPPLPMRPCNKSGLWGLSTGGTIVPRTLPLFVSPLFLNLPGNTPHDIVATQASVLSYRKGPMHAVHYRTSMFKGTAPIDPPIPPTPLV